MGKHIIFDWGDTIMRDDPSRQDAMYLWPTVELVPGAGELLEQLSKTHILSIATSVLKSDEETVRKSFKRVDVDGYIANVFTAKQAGFKKTEQGFWRHILHALNVPPDEITMVGDNFEGDVLMPVSVGFRAVWFNPVTTEDRQGPSYHTIHRLADFSV